MKNPKTGDIHSQLRHIQPGSMKVMINMNNYYVTLHALEKNCNFMRQTMEIINLQIGNNMFNCSI